MLDMLASVAKMGGRVLPNYKLDKSPSLESIELRWSVYGATNAPNQPLSAFVFEKKIIDKYAKQNREAILETLRKDAHALQRLRHPNVLHVIEPLVDERYTMAFVVRGIKSNLAQMLDKDAQNLTALEMKCGLLDIAEAIRFLHQDAKTAHLGVAPVNIFVTEHGKWLLGGFGYSIGGVQKAVSVLNRQYMVELLGRTCSCVTVVALVETCRDIKSPPTGIPQDCGFLFNTEDMGELSPDPSLKYCAPEISAGFPGKVGMEADVFSLGLVAYEVMSAERKPLLAALSRHDRHGHKQKLEQMLPFRRTDGLPSELASVLPALLTPDPAHRCEVLTFVNSPFFQDINIKALRFLVDMMNQFSLQCSFDFIFIMEGKIRVTVRPRLRAVASVVSISQSSPPPCSQETLNEKEDAQKAQFLKGFQSLLEQPGSELTEDRIVRERVLPQLVKALNYPPLYGQVLTNILICLRKPGIVAAEEFQRKMWDGMRILFTAKEIPIEAVLDLLRNLDMLMELTEATQINETLLPFLLRCLELNEPTIQYEVLAMIPQIHKKFEYRHVKDQILPRMLSTLLNPSTTLKSRVQTLMGINQMFSVFDRATICDTILEACARVQKIERAPAFCMVLLSCYDAMSKFLGPTETARKILPLATPLLAEESLGADQWRTQMEVCKKLLSRVETARAKEYETRRDAAGDVNAALGSPPAGGGDAMGDMFGGDSKKSTAPAPDADAMFLTQLGGGGAVSSSGRPPSGGPPMYGGSSSSNVTPAFAPPPSSGGPSGTSGNLLDDFDFGSGGGAVSTGPGRPVSKPTTNGTVGTTSSTAGDPFSLMDSGSSKGTGASKSSFPSSFPPPGGGAATKPSSSGGVDDLLGLGAAPPKPVPGSEFDLLGGGSTSSSSQPQTKQSALDALSNPSTFGQAPPSNYGGIANFSGATTGVSSNRVGMANIQGDPFAELTGSSSLGAAGGGTGSQSTGGMGGAQGGFGGGMGAYGGAGGMGGMQPGAYGGMQPGGGMGGMKPGGMQPGGMQPGGMQPGGMQPGGMQSGGMQPGGMQPGGMGGMRSGVGQPGARPPGQNDDPFAGLM